MTEEEVFALNAAALGSIIEEMKHELANVKTREDLEILVENARDAFDYFDMDNY